MLLAISVVVVPSAVATTDYNRQAAANYALSNWNNNVDGSSYFNPYDCTNFVSNCVKAGGWTETYEPSNYWQHFWRRANAYAWYSVSSENWYSYNWGGAENFGNFISCSNRGWVRSLNHHPWSQYFKTGDIVQIDNTNDGIQDHTMIVTAVGHDELYMTYHSSNTINKPLTQIIHEVRNEYPEYPNAYFTGYNLYDDF